MKKARSGFKNLNLGGKITLMIGALFSIALITLGLIASREATNTLHDTISLTLADRATDGAKLVEQKLHTMITAVEGVAAMSEMKTMDWSFQEIVLQREMGRVGAYQMGVAELDGSFFLTTGDISNVFDRAHFQNALQGKLAVSDPIISKTDQMLMVAIAAPIKNDQGHTIGVLIASYDGMAFCDLVAQINVGNDGSSNSFMINKAGTTIAHSTNRDLVLEEDNDFENEKRDPTLKPLADIERKMVAGEAGVGEYTYKGVTKYMAYAPVSGTTWSLALAVEKSTLFAGVRRLQLISMITVFFFIVIGMVLLYLTIKQMVSRPITKLVAAAKVLASGDVNVDIQVKSKDEIGVLSQVFKDMAAGIKDQAQIGQKIADGDLTVEVTVRSEQDILALSLNQVVTNLRELITDTGKLTQAAVEGRLNERGDVNKFKGGFQEIVKGVNNTLDAVITPLDEAMKVLQRMAVNDYTVQMSGNYQGMLQEFAQDINLTREVLLVIQKTIVQISQGDTSSMDELAKVGRRSENDQMMPALINMSQAVRDLIEEVARLAEAGVSGDLQVRGEVNKFQGGYGEIIKGFNQTLDAIDEPINEALEVLQEMAQGNLDVYMTGQYQGDHAALKEAVNTALDNFNVVLGEINSAAEQVAAGSNQVSSSSQVLSQGSAEQASTIEEITASVTEIAAQTKQNAANAVKANEISLGAKDKAVQGNNQMKGMLNAMDDIDQSSNDISKIIKVIDDIAFQTNILALNAAVEAARAGQHGKGFAVVAEEVRNLAAKSANAAKETTTMIEGSIKKVEAGTKMAQNTAEALNQIVDGVTQTTELVGEIAIASNEQATGIAQINQGISQVSEVVQGNTATSEESAAASEEMSAQAALLKTMVEKFKIRASQLARAENPTIEKKATAKKGVKLNKRNIILDDADFVKY